MRKSYISLRHQQYIDIMQPQFTSKSRICALLLIPHSTISSILDFLRLSQITQLYNSLAFNHEHQQVKFSIFNYLVLRTRPFSKWEEKQFLDTLIINLQRKIVNNPNRKRQIHSRQASDQLIFSTHWRNPSKPLQYSQNDRSRIIRCKQSILNDVDRTFLKASGRNSSQKIQQREHSIKNLVKAPFEIATKYNTEISDKEAYSCSLTLITQPPSKSYYSDQRYCLFTSSAHSESEKKMQQNYDPCTFIQLAHQQSMQRFLKTVLLSTCSKYEKVGYIQGFNYIAKNMFLTGFTQEEACRYLSFFIEQKYLGNVIFSNMAGIKKLSYALKVYIFNYVPAVYQHFNKVQLEPEVFCMSWFVTLFSEDLSVEIVNKLWHLFALQGWKIFIQFSISFLCAYQPEILTKESDQIFSFMRRIMENFNQQCKIKNKLGHRAWGKNPKRQETVWKLMTSVEINGNILNKLCQEMNNLQSDSEIELWRIEDSRNSQMPRNLPKMCGKSLSAINQSRQRERLAGSQTAQTNKGGAELCCDRMFLQTNQHSYGQCRSTNIFSLCHNVDTCIN